MAFLFLRQRGKINNLYVIASARKESSAEKAYKLIGSGPISSNIVYKNKQFDNIVQIYNINEEKLTEFSKQKGINIMEKPLDSYNSTNMGRKHFYPLPPNRTGDFLAYGSPVDGFYIEIDKLGFYIL